jgi:hypothetical protein
VAGEDASLTFFRKGSEHDLCSADYEVRRHFFAEHWKIRTIAAQLNLHLDTVCGAIERRSKQ